MCSKRGDFCATLAGPKLPSRMEPRASVVMIVCSEGVGFVIDFCVCVFSCGVLGALIAVTRSTE